LTDEAFIPSVGYRPKREHKIVIIDGPNMSNLGARNKRVYGAIASLEDLQDLCKSRSGKFRITMKGLSIGGA
jgi:3-dehydroquinate dehydratase II